MKKIIALCSLLTVISACSKTDPVLPGQRENIFGGSAIMQYDNKSAIKDLPSAPLDIKNDECPCTIDSANIIWSDNKKIFSGFATDNYVQCDKKPVCDGGFVYAGLSTGELVKVNLKTRNIAWIADIYKSSNMLGGASVLDIVAPIVVTNADVYAGGLGDAFCKLNKSNGSKKWCVDIGTSVSFIITDVAVFIVGTDNNLYAIDARDGGIHWRAAIKKQTAPVFRDGMIIVGRQKFNAANGELIK